MGQGLTDPWGVVLAAAPILCIVVAILCRVRALHAVLIAIGVTLLLSFRFPFGWSEVHDRAGSLGSVIVTVVFILLGGILLSEQLAVSGAQDRISEWLSAAVRTSERALLLIGIGVAPLAESVIGFGVGVIVSIPLLMWLGIGATRSTSVSLLGIFLAPWGSLGPGLMIASGLSGIDIHELGAWTAVANVPVVAVMVAAIAIVGLGWRGAVRSVAEWGAAAALMVATVYVCSRWITPALGGVAASLVGIAVLIACAVLRGHYPPAMDTVTRRAFGPYALLIIAMLVVTGLAQTLDLGSWHSLVTNPGLWLVVTAALSPGILRLARADASVAARRGLRLWVPVCGLNILYIVFGALVSINGMTGELAGAAALLGGGFIVLTPVIGYVAGYATASNSGSSAMLASGITSTAHTLGADAAAILGLQNAATGAAIMASPSRVAIADRIANQQAEEGDRVDARTVLRHVLTAGAAAVVLLTIASSVAVLA